VTVCNIARVPLDDASVDACVFCLSLMGTDYGSFVKEAARILRSGGCLWIAEVTSRAIQRAENFNVVPDLIAAIESLGFSLERKHVQDSSYFFELVFRKEGKGSSKAAPFPELRACAYKKR
jgi:ribosomal RNA-processing protein 8